MKDPDAAILEMYDRVCPGLTPTQRESLGHYMSGWRGALMETGNLPETYEDAQKLADHIYDIWSNLIKK